MKDLLLEIKTLVDERKGVSKELNAAEIKDFEERVEVAHYFPGVFMKFGSLLF